jgi:hypothetical protein
MMNRSIVGALTTTEWWIGARRFSLLQLRWRDIANRLRRGKTVSQRPAFSLRYQHAQDGTSELNSFAAGQLVDDYFVV